VENAERIRSHDPAIEVEIRECGGFDASCRHATRDERGGSSTARWIINSIAVELSSGARVFVACFLFYFEIYFVIYMLVFSHASATRCNIDGINSYAYVYKSDVLHLYATSRENVKTCKCPESLDSRQFLHRNIFIARVHRILIAVY